MPSPLAVKRDIAVTVLVRCMCVCPGHNSYIYAWISKLFGTVVVLEKKKCHFKNFIGKLKVKVTLEVHINQLVRAITRAFMHGFQNNLTELFSLRSSSAIETFVRVG